MEKIKQWFNSNMDYADGVALYLQFGNNAFLKQRFQVNSDSYNRKKLNEELEKLAGETTHINPKEEGRPPQKNNLDADTSKYLALKKNRDEVVKQIERNMAVLDLSTSKKNLFETAKQILKLHQRKTELWSQIDFFDQYGHFEPLPAKKEIPKEKEIQLLYQSISKANKRLANPAYKNRTKTQELRDKQLARLNELKNHE